MDLCQHCQREPANPDDTFCQRCRLVIDGDATLDGE